jgi:hypothetical protein
MARVRVGGTTNEGANTSNTISTAWPGGTAAGDFAFLLLSWFENGVGAFTTPPTGFTRIGTSIVIAGVPGSDGESRVDLWYRELDGSEAGSVSATHSGSFNLFCTIILDVYRGDGVLTFASATAGTPGTGFGPVTIPDVAGSNGQLQWAALGVSDPTTASDPADMALGLAGIQNTNTCYTFYKYLTGAISAQDTTLGTSRGHVGISVLVNDAGAGGGGDTVTMPWPVYQTSKGRAAGVVASGFTPPSK